MKFTWRTPNKSSSTKHITIQRYIPKEWRQTHTERENWHQYRKEQMVRTPQNAPLVGLDSLLTVS